MAANWRQQKEERERAARERDEEERRKKEQKIRQLLLQAPTPSGTHPGSPSTSSSSSSSSSPHSSTSSLPVSSPAAAAPHPPTTTEAVGGKSDEHEHAKVTPPAANAAAAAGSGWTKPVAAAQSSAKTSFLGQERGKEQHDHDHHEVEAAGQMTVHELQAQLAKRDEEVRMLKEAYKQRMREKEDEFKQRWAAQNEAEALAHKLNEAESRAKSKEAEVKRLQEQVHQLNLLMMGKKVIALYNFNGNGDDDELSFVEGDVIEVLEQVNEGWWEGRLTNGDQGIFPFNYVQPLVIFSASQPSSSSKGGSRIEHHATRHGDEGEADDDDGHGAPAHPKMSTLEKAAYAKKKIEEKYKELSKTLLAPSSTGGENDEDHHQHAHAPVETGSDHQRHQALFDFEAQNEGELSFKQGDHILVAPVEQASSEWRYGYIGDREGHFPATYIDAASH